MRTKWLALLIALCAALSACSYSGSRDHPRNGANAAAAEPSAQPSVVINQDTRPAPPSSTSAVIKKVLPSVVNVRVTALNQGLFGSSKAKAEGSGVIIDKNGVILTNNHVIAGAVNVTVKFNDGVHDVMDGTVIGADPTHDLAVIRVAADDLTSITVGSSGNLRLGDPVIALGYPLGLGGPTVTKGIVSGLHRTIDVQKQAGDSEHLTGLLQTDAAINPGNSGGALVDTEGRLVGINTAAAQASSAENIGFAISIDEALPYVKNILTAGPSDQAWMGVSIGDAQALNLPGNPKGAVVIEAIPGSPAAAAGLKQGDVITKVGTYDISTRDDLTNALTHYGPHDKVTIEYLRDGNQHSVRLELARRPATFAPVSPSPSPSS